MVPIEFITHINPGFVCLVHAYGGCLPHRALLPCYLLRNPNVFPATEATLPWRGKGSYRPYGLGGAGKCVGGEEEAGGCGAAAPVTLPVT